MIGQKETDDNNLGIIFEDEKTQEYHELIETQVKASLQNGSSSIINTDDGYIINVDDI
jgi:hypothetical protein